MMDRRAFIAMVGGSILAAPLAAEAQQSGRVYRVRRKVDVIVAINTPASFAAKHATATTPIVFARVSDPVRTGLVASSPTPAETSPESRVFGRTQW
jgi:ABC-type uncharacterized transport system substrate-binding protein